MTISGSVLLTSAALVSAKAPQQCQRTFFTAPCPVLLFIYDNLSQTGDVSQFSRVSGNTMPITELGLILLSSLSWRINVV